MTRDEVLSLHPCPSADELELDPARVQEGTRFKEDLEADSLDLYSLVQELEDTYGVRMSDEEAARITTVGQAVDFVLANVPRPASRGPDPCARSHDLLEGLPDDLARQAVTHASWTERRADSYERLALLGDSVLGLSITTHLFPLLDAETLRRRAADEDPRAGGLGPLVPRGGRAARAAGAAAGGGAGGGRAATLEALVATERVLASVIEAVIGACYLAYGFEPTAAAVREAFAPEIEQALERPADFKSALQERLARRGAIVSYEVDGGDGPAARADLRGRGGGGREQRRARLRALEEGGRAGGRRRRARRPTWRHDVHLRSITPEGLQVVPGPHAARLRARASR